MKYIDGDSADSNEKPFQDRPAHCGGCRGFLPVDVLRHDLDNKQLFDPRGRPLPRQEASLCYSLAHIFPKWAAAQGIHPLNYPGYKIPTYVFKWWEPEYRDQPLTAEQERLVNEHEHLIDTVIATVTGKRPPPKVIYEADGKPVLEDSKVSGQRSAGAIGLMNAVRTYDRSRGTEFKSWASLLIRQQLSKADRDNGWRRDALHQLGEVSADQPVGDGGSATVMDFLPDTQETETALPAAALETIRLGLSEREFFVFDERLDGRTQREIAEGMGISPQAVSVIEARATKRALHAVNKTTMARLEATITRSEIGDEVRRPSLYPTFSVYPSVVLAAQRRMIYRRDWVTQKEWDDIRFRQEWHAQGCNPEKWKFSKRKRDGVPDDGWERCNPLRADFDPDPPLRDRFLGLKSSGMTRATELSHARAVHLRNNLVARGLDGSQTFDEAVVNTIAKSRGWMCIKKVRGGWVASRPPRTTPPVAAAQYEVAA